MNTSQRGPSQAASQGIQTNDHLPLKNILYSQQLHNHKGLCPMSTRGSVDRTTCASIFINNDQILSLRTMVIEPMVR